MTTLWRLTAHADFKTLAEAAEALDAAYPAIALSWSLFDDSDPARLDVLFDAEPDAAGFRKNTGLADSITVTIEPVPNEDWIRLSLQGLKPVEAGRFIVFGEHDRDEVPGDKISLEIEAGPAFGTGHHGTTRGCLLAFDAMLNAGESPASIFDLGCGTAALAIAAAKTLPDAEVLASDIDPEAVEESQVNCTKNGAPDIDCFVAEGLEHDKLKGRKFELIFANILAGPLVELASGIAKALASGGKVILSGLLSEQEAWVREAYETAGLTVERRVPIDGWETLIAVKA